MKNFAPVKVPAKYCWKSGKVMFDKKGAVTAANLRFKQDHVQLTEYVCGFCRTWHLTKKRE